MSDKNFNLNHGPRLANIKLGYKATKLVRRVVIPALLLGALMFVTSEHSVVPVKADDCSDAYMTLSVCYTSCSNISDNWARIQCFGQCELYHGLAGATCGMPSHSPMIVTGGGCDAAANGQRTYDNCMAGTLPQAWQEQYTIYMAYYNDMETSCTLIGQTVEAQGCY